MEEEEQGRRAAVEAARTVLPSAVQSRELLLPSSLALPRTSSLTRALPPPPLPRAQPAIQPAVMVSSKPSLGIAFGSYLIRQCISGHLFPLPDECVEARKRLRRGREKREKRFAALKLLPLSISFSLSLSLRGAK